MKTVYLECKMGASGDMLLGALLDLIPDKDRWIQKFNQIGIPHMQAQWKTDARCGISGTHVSIYINGQEEHSEDLPGTPEPPHREPHSQHSHEHHEDGVHPQEKAHHYHPHTHSTLKSVHHIIDSLDIPENVRQKAKKIYQTLANAEAAVHGHPVEKIHFHEVGELDAIADIVGTCMLLDELAPDRILASPIHVGSGQVHCAHGILPVPAPATARLLQGIPFYSGTISGELCTPTGAALLRSFVEEFTDHPVIQYDRLGCGLGTKELPAANILRAFWQDHSSSLHHSSQTIAELRCSLDDMSAEAIGYAQEILLNAGALDVFTAPIQMKKNRPGTLLCVSCRPEQTEEMAKLILTHTTTAGVRKLLYDRYTLDYYFTEKQTPYGKIRLKHYKGYGIEKIKPEYQDVAEAAAKAQISYETVFHSAISEENSPE